jgi:hypothetical protein
VVNAKPRPLCPRVEPRIHYVSGGMRPRAEWTVVKKRTFLATKGVRTPDRPFLSRSLYRLRFPIREGRLLR